MKKAAIALILLAVLLVPAAPASGDWMIPAPPITDLRITSGPEAPDVLTRQAAQDYTPTLAAVVIRGVPAYLWHYGCGTTAAAMLLGYWDGRGYGWLMPGSAATQTPEINEVIASESGDSNHISDYANPRDLYPDLRPDKSELPERDRHANNSLADFMKSSQSVRYNFYGWTAFGDIAPALADYISWTQPGDYRGEAETFFVNNGEWTWEQYVAEIQAARPVLLFIDPNGDGVGDHLVTAIGYDETGDERRYAFHDTWDRRLHWAAFLPEAAGAHWGVTGAVTLRIYPELPPLHWSYFPFVSGDSFSGSPSSIR